MKRALWILAVLVLAGAGAWLWRRQQTPRLVLTDVGFGVVQHADLESLISATGTLQATETVDVGTQVSGTIARLPVAAGAHVRKGEILAVIDTELLDAAIRDAEAGLARATAQLDQAKADLARQRPLFAQGLISAADLSPFETAIKTAQASQVSAQSTLDRAHKNRANAVIVSPIDGVVLDRPVEVGQTVAASFSTPRLFLVAHDLAQMEILADVDEGDIGQVKVGQPAHFTVAAYADRSFEGQVTEIRLQPKTEQNVVKYTVLIDAPNPDLALLPGMTATVDIVVAVAEGALAVPTAALRLRPNAAFYTLVTGAAANTATAGAGAERHGGGNGDRTGGGDRTNSGDRGARAGTVVWLRAADGTHLEARSVRVGLSDSRRTAVTPLDGPLDPGAEVVISLPAAASAAPPATPQQTGQQRNFRMPF